MWTLNWLRDGEHWEQKHGDDAYLYYGQPVFQRYEPYVSKTQSTVTIPARNEEAATFTWSEAIFVSIMVVAGPGRSRQG